MEVLLLDSAFGAVPIHDYLVGVGCEVWTVGNRAWDQLAAAYPERWIKADYGDVAGIRSLIQARGFEAVVPGCTDVSMSTFSQLGFDRHYRWSQKVDRIVNDKPLFRELCETLKLPSPRAFRADALPPGGRLICKPADSYSGRGVTVFDSADQVATADAIATARAMSPQDQAIIEEFVEGQLYSYSAFVEDGRVDVAYIVKEGSRYDPFAVDLSYVVERYDAAKLRILQDAVEAVARELDFCDGLLHLQFIDSGDRIALLEMTRRCPGDLYPLLIEWTLGIPYAARFASYFIGKRVQQGPSATRRHVLRHTVKQQTTSHFRGLDLSHLEAAPFSVVPLARLGEPGVPAQKTRAALIFLEGESEIDIAQRYERLKG